MRAMAGFKVEGTYHVRRAEVPPPDGLLAKVFPDVSRCLEFVERQPRAELAPQGFLRLVKYSREVVLQDAAVLMERFPQHPMWRAAVFSDPEFAAFATQVRSHNAATDTPMDVQIRQAMPLVAEQLSCVRNSLDSKSDFWGRKLETEIGEVKDLVLDMHRKSNMDIQATVLIHRGDGPPTVAGGSFALPLPPPAPTPAATAERPPGSATGQERVAEVASSSRDVSHTYQMSRNCTTIADMWREWTVGLGGMASVEDLDRELGSKWRRSPKEAVWYSQRKYLVGKIREHLKRLGVEAGPVVQQLDTRRIVLKWSLDRLIKETKKGWWLSDI